MNVLANNMRNCIRQLSLGQSISGEQLVACIEELLSGSASAAQIGAFLVLLRVDTLKPELIFLTSQRIIAHALECSASGDIFDVVGTGGDNWDTWNVSTASSFVIASCGIKVAKHGNRSSSGRIGSADFIEALGANILIDNKKTSQILEECGFAFLFSQQFHPAIKQASIYRKEIGVRTIFNILGPLVNPTRPTHMLVGVSVPELGPTYAQILALNPRIKRAMVVQSVSGLDEIGIDGETRIWNISAGNPVTQFSITPEDFGITRRDITSIVGGATPQANADIFRDILSDKPNMENYCDWLCMNCAVGLVLLSKAKDWKEGFSMAKEVIRNGTVKKLLDLYIQKTNQK